MAKGRNSTKFKLLSPGKLDTREWSYNRQMMSAIAKAEALNSKECYWHDINFYTYDILPFYGLFLKNGNRKLCNNNRIPEVYSELSQSSKMKL